MFKKKIFEQCSVKKIVPGKNYVEIGYQDVLMCLKLLLQFDFTKNIHFNGENIRARFV